MGTSSREPIHAPGILLWAVITPWAPGRWGAKQPNWGSNLVLQTSVFPSVK